MSATDTTITEIERADLSRTLNGAGSRELDSVEFCADAIREYDAWLAESGRVYEYTGDLDAAIYATFGGEVGYERVAVTGDATKAASPKAMKKGKE